MLYEAILIAHLAGGVRVNVVDEARQHPSIEACEASIREMRDLAARKLPPHTTEARCVPIKRPGLRES